MDEMNRMETRIRTIPIPPQLYEKVRRAQVAGLITDFRDFAHEVINDRLDQLFREDWQRGIRELRESIARTTPPMTEEEILAQLRRTREEVWDEEYAMYYPNLDRIAEEVQDETTRSHRQQ